MKPDNLTTKRMPFGVWIMVCFWAFTFGDIIYVPLFSPSSPIFTSHEELFIHVTIGGVLSVCSLLTFVSASKKRGQELRVKLRKAIASLMIILLIFLLTPLFSRYTGLEGFSSTLKYLVLNSKAAIAWFTAIILLNILLHLFHRHTDCST